ncbi:MAG: DNA polymerase I [Verrucomicrobiae bacterium]|nr:DNA polymerase I [Verrucomicrobiae bacterium]
MVEIDGEEADDIIATLAVQAAGAGLSVLIASNDKDFTQLVNNRICLVRPGEKEDALFDSTAVETKYGLRPSQMVDYLALTGDTVDNIRGVPGVGEKTAVELLRRYNNLEGVLAHAAEISRPKLRESLLRSVSEVRQNRQLVELVTNLPVNVALSDLRVCPPDSHALIAALRSHGFKSLTTEVEQEFQPGGDLFAAR